ncbi:Uncharacterised protein [BD1-7 clade bacterium]|uniref:Uncharacterized protein n=1 Tax=BD1-7 clade bacterium TaxID=2029982 RepID=A0A5S9PQ06_9GAMM|nr:Uncharacterised protein [BD1-7 clade bacterium]CAA0106245.1 Uncharacterised protein [BD1-7 clade bacterium]
MYAACVRFRLSVVFNRASDAVSSDRMEVASCPYLKAETISTRYNS